jgi:gliding motility-associated-like protein
MSTGATAQTLNNPTTGVYTLSISDASGCSANQSTTVTLVGAPNLSAYIGQINTQDTSIFLGETIQIGAGSNQSGLAYVWSELNNPSQAGISTPNLANSAVNPNQNGNYVFVISATVAGQNCSATDTIRLLVRAYDAIQLPTAFSPNNDGENDFYRPIGLDIQHIQAFRIHNRWGQILYDSPQLSGGGWDGTFNGSLQARDVYISTLIYKRPQDAQATELRIEFTLLR